MNITEYSSYSVNSYYSLHKTVTITLHSQHTHMCVHAHTHKPQQLWGCFKKHDFTQSEPVGEDDDRVQIFSPSRAWTITCTVWNRKEKIHAHVLSSAEPSVQNLS